jgi:hypothetical protein
LAFYPDILHAYLGMRMSNKLGPSSDYQVRIDEARRLARHAPDEKIRAVLLKIAEQWELLIGLVDNRVSGNGASPNFNSKAGPGV